MIKKPYLVIPFLIEQSTWGGDYICQKKGWLDKEDLKGKKIGQSYELYDKSFLATAITSSEDAAFSPNTKDHISISTFKETRPFPLIKFTQAKGNSFQLHVKTGVRDSRWRQKAESWYYFEKGKMTFGLKKGTDINKYKEVCLVIQDKMKEVSQKIIKREITQEDARLEVRSFIQEKNPWHFVNVCDVQKGDIIDLSGGGIHHSWEEDAVHYPLGNILYEVQQDIMDPDCTIRSFDQGKFKEDGTIRELHINDYFKYIDQDEKRNIPTTHKIHSGRLFDTPFYTLDLIQLSSVKEMESSSSFHHIFVKEGSIEVQDEIENKLFVGEGHSCFIPKDILYTIKPSSQSELLLTFLK